MISRIICIAAFLSLGSEAAAQAAMGKVVDEATGLPLVGVTLSLMDESGGLVVQVASDGQGRYLVRAPRSGSYRLVADNLGYRRLESPLAVLDEEGPMTIDFELPLDPIEVEGVRVEAERREALRARVASYGVRVDDLGRRFIPQEEIERRQSARDFGEVLEWRALPGVSVLRSENSASSGLPFVCVTTQRGRTGAGQYRCALTVLDGRIVNERVAALVPPESIGAIAFLTPIEATLVFGTGGGGGAVLLFTRTGANAP